MKPKRELIRAVRSPEGEISLDFVGKSPGRGAYICRDQECLKRAIKSKALSRAFKTAIPEDIMDAFNKEITSSSSEENYAS
jgi:hypothetical protein